MVRMLKIWNFADSKVFGKLSKEVFNLEKLILALKLKIMMTESQTSHIDDSTGIYQVDIEIIASDFR